MWIQEIKDFLVTIVLVVLSLDVLLRLVEALFGFDPFRKWKLQKEREQLRELGLLPPHIAYHQQTAIYLGSNHPTSVPNFQADLNALLKRYTRDLRKLNNIGRGQQHIKARYFIDFNAPLASDLEIMAEILAQFITKELARINQVPAINFSKLAIPHRGNPALGIALTRHDPFKDCPYTLIGDPAVQGWRFSGAEIKPGDIFILIDDIAASGSSLEDCARLLRDHGAKINHAFVLVERTDASRQNMPTPSDRLRGVDVTLHAFLCCDDSQLAQKRRDKHR